MPALLLAILSMPKEEQERLKERIEFAAKNHPYVSDEEYARNFRESFERCRAAFRKDLKSQ